MTDVLLHRALQSSRRLVARDFSYSCRQRRLRPHARGLALAASQPRRDDHSSRNENDHQHHGQRAIDPFHESPRPPFLSYRAAAAIVATAASFLAYRLFFYSPNTDDAALDARSFVVRRLRHIVALSPSLALLDLSSAQTDAADELWTSGVWSLEVKQPQLQIARAYTPLPPVKRPDESEGAWQNRTKGLRLLVRREPQGEVSPYLHSLPAGSTLELRGPRPELLLPPDVSEVVFLAGGTGIAPAMQVAYALSRRAATATSTNPVRMSVLWSVRTRDDTGATAADAPASIPAQLDAIAGDGRAGGRFALRTTTFVDDEGTLLKDKDVGAALTAPAAADQHAIGAQDGGRRIVLVSGPDGFVAHVAGPKVVRGGVEEQGPVGGLLGRARLDGWQVWKL